MKIEEFLRLLKEGESERVEFKVRAGRDIGAEIVAMANALGGYILIGVDDRGNIVGCDLKKTKEIVSGHLANIFPSPEIKFEKVSVGKKNVLVIKVTKSERLLSIGGVAYVRVGTAKRPMSIHEVAALGAEAGLLSLDALPTDVGAKEMKKEYWHAFVKAVRSKGKAVPKDYEEKLGVVVKKDGKRVLSFAGLLFFHKEPQILYPHTALRIISNGYDERLVGPIWKLVDKAEKKVFELIPKVELKLGFRRMVINPFPPEAVREGIVNALVHRNYAIHSECFIYVNPLMLKIINPGSFLPGTSPENPRPMPRNPKLYELMYLMGYVERQGRGIELIKESCSELGIDVKYELESRFTSLILDRTAAVLDEFHKKLLLLLGDWRSASELSKLSGISKPSILKRLKLLVRLGLVDIKGKGPSTRYRAKKF